MYVATKIIQINEQNSNSTILTHNLNHLIKVIKLFNTLGTTYIKIILICINMWSEMLIKFIKQIKYKTLCNE